LFYGGPQGRGLSVRPSLLPAPRSVEGVDLLRGLASKVGVGEEHVEVCYEGRDVYDWCLALLGGSDQPPPHPFPLRLFNLAVKLIGEGKLTADRVRVLGLDKILSHVISGKAEGVVRMIERIQIPDRSELAKEASRVVEMYRRVEKAIPIEEIASKLKEMARRSGVVKEDVVERTLIPMLRGEIKPEKAVEEIIATRTEKRGEEVLRTVKGRAEARTEAKPLHGRAETPKGG